MKYKKYFRKTSLKQKNIGDLFLDIIQKKNPKTFLEIGIFHGVTARNVCEIMFKNHGDNFNYIGIDIFDNSNTYDKEVVPSKTFNNPFKTFYFRYIKKQNPYSLIAVEDLLSKFKKNIKIIQGDTNQIFHEVSLKNIDFIFIDGGHDYKTVKNDLEQSFKIINKNGTILCDDWNLSQALGVREAIKDFSKEQNLNFEIVHERFAQFNLQ